MADKMYVEYTDQAGGFVRTSNSVAAGGLPAGFDTALETLTNANVGAITDGTPTPPGPVAGSGQYSLCTTTAVLNFLSSSGAGIQVTIPAPVAAMFGPDGVTVNAASVPVAAFIALCIGFLVDGAGNPCTSFNTGVKSSRKVEQVG